MPFEVFFRRKSTFAFDRYVKTKTNYNAEKWNSVWLKTIEDLKPNIVSHDTVRVAITAFTEARELAEEDIKRTALWKREELNQWSPDVFEVLSMRKFDDRTFKYQIKGIDDRLFAQRDLKKIEAGLDMIRLGKYKSGNATFNQGPKHEHHLQTLQKNWATEG